MGWREQKTVDRGDDRRYDIGVTCPDPGVRFLSNAPYSDEGLAWPTAADRGGCPDHLTGSLRRDHDSATMAPMSWRES